MGTSTEKLYKIGNIKCPLIDSSMIVNGSAEFPCQDFPCFIMCGDLAEFLSPDSLKASVCFPNAGTGRELNP